MPVKIRDEADPVANRQELTAALLDEWRHQAGGPEAPDIEVVQGGAVFGMIGKPLRITVVWQRWAGVGQGDRASIIMDAFQQVAEQPEDILRVTAVRGLMPGER